jgi:hypothetical protein
MLEDEEKNGVYQIFLSRTKVYHFLTKNGVFGIKPQNINNLTN